MVGIVIVSHSRRIAEGVVELAREMGGAEVVLKGAGGTEEEDALGTDAMLVLGAIDEAYSDDGVLVLMDLGSAVMSAEMAVEMLDEEKRAREPSRRPPPPSWDGRSTRSPARHGADSWESKLTSGLRRKQRSNLCKLRSRPRPGHQSTPASWSRTPSAFTPVPPRVS
jgi:dihydroxyacetone kinase phosphotransfer subunit